MPIYAPGALFLVGDAHAAQGQGEVDLTTIETGLRGKFQFIVRKDMKITWPRGETPTRCIVMGFNPNLEEAMKTAVRETILFITQRFPSFRVRRPTRLRASRSIRRHQGHPRHDPEGDFSLRSRRDTKTNEYASGSNSPVVLHRGGRQLTPQ